MNMVKNIGIAIVGTVIFSLAVRTGFQAEKEASGASKAK